MRLALLDFGEIVSTTDNGTIRRVPVPGALIQTDAGEYVLVDTGMPEQYVGNSDPIPRLTNSMAAVMERHHTAAGQLELVGLRPADVRYVISTHFDWDHAGANTAFPHATFFVQRAHLTAAPNDPRYWRELWNVPGLRYVVIDGDAEPVPGVRVIETSGHVVGHQSVLVDLPTSGRIILAIDAIKDEHQVATAHWEGPDIARSRASGERLLALAREPEDAAQGRIVYGHDPEQWQHLRHAPAWYD